MAIVENRSREEWQELKDGPLAKEDKNLRAAQKKLKLVELREGADSAVRESTVGKGSPFE